MARLARITQRIFASSASNNGVFGSAQTAGGAGTLTNVIATIMAGSAWLNGWLLSVIGGSKFPPLEEFQAVEYVHSTQIAYLLQQGIAEYDSGTVYFTNNVCLKAGTYQIYGSVTDNNTGNALTDASNWKLLVDLSTVGAGNPVYSGGTSTGSANAQVCASPTPAGFALTNGYTLTFIAGFSNSGATTMNANATGVTAVYKNSGGGPIACVGGEIVAGNTISITYNSTLSKFVITNSGGLLASNNLSDVASAPTSLTNLGAAASATTVTGAGCATGGGALTTNQTITVTAATKSDQTTGTSVTHPVVPNTQQNHASACKAWVMFTGSTGAIVASYNVASVTRNSTGDYTVNFTTNFTSANYCPVITPLYTASNALMGQVKSLAAGTAEILLGYSGNSAVLTPVDPTTVYAAFFGTQ